MSEQLRLGVVGAAGRGMAFRLPASLDDRVDVRAVCDVSTEGVAEAAEAFDAPETYTDFHAMLWEASLDAVLVGTPKEHHVPQSVAALERGLHVLCEVPAARSVEECRELVRAVEASAGRYMLAENDVFRRAWAVVAELVTDGRFGDVYYARGERVTDDTGKLEATPWRRTWRGGRDGVTYPTHVLGPLLRWLPDDRLDRLACAGSGHHYEGPRGERYEQSDTVAVLGKTERDRLVVQRQDILSERPPVPYRFELQGTRGCFESAQDGSDDHRVSFADDEGWQPLSAHEPEYLPPAWRSLPERAGETGRDGGDYLCFEAFVDAVMADETPPIDVHEGLDMTLPGLVSERSVERGGAWVDVPDSREW